MVPLKAGQLAKQAHINVETLRYYEREGLMPTPQRTEAGYRLYQQADIKRVQFIKKAQSLGFTLSEIKDLLMLTETPYYSARNVKQLTQQKIDLIQQKIVRHLTK
jgi:DNA-binding transcriptional MerR regulator